MESNAKKYAVIDDETSARSEVYGSEKLYDDKVSALAEAAYQWSHKTESEKAACNAFYVVYGEPDEDGCLMDGEVIWDAMDRQFKVSYSWTNNETVDWMHDTESSMDDNIGAFCPDAAADIAADYIYEKCFATCDNVERSGEGTEVEIECYDEDGKRTEIYYNFKVEEVLPC